MKILAISGQLSLRLTMVKVLELLMENVKVISSDHDDALVFFLAEEPDAVIVYEYDETERMEDHSRGVATYNDIKGSAQDSVIIIRLGFSDYLYENYLKLPFELPILIKMLRP